MTKLLSLLSLSTAVVASGETPRTNEISRKHMSLGPTARDMEAVLEHDRQLERELNASHLSPPAGVAQSYTKCSSNEIEEALWALYSYESNRDEAGRVYSEADITRMVQAVRVALSAKEVKPAPDLSPPAGVAQSSSERTSAALHACEGLDTSDLAKNERGWLAKVVHSAARVESDLNSALRACCPGNGEDPEPVRCQAYEASEQGAPCPPGCCVMAEPKDMRDVLAAIEREEGPAPV